MMFDCLIQCGLFFRGAGKLPFAAHIRPVRELIDWLLTDRLPADRALGAPGAT